MSTERRYDRDCLDIDVIASLDGLTAGRYGSTDLYVRYRAHCASHGRLGSRQVLYSRTLARLGVEFGMLNGRREWYVTDGLAAGVLPSGSESSTGDVTLTVFVPRSVYNNLVERGARVNRSPERMASTLIGDEVGY